MIPQCWPSVQLSQSYFCNQLVATVANELKKQQEQEKIHKDMEDDQNRRNRDREDEDHRRKRQREEEDENLKTAIMKNKMARMSMVAEEIKRLKELGLENLAKKQEQEYEKLMASM